MKHLLTALCLSATLCSAMTATAPAHALPKAVDFNAIGTEIKPVPPVPLPPKAELVMTSWITGQTLPYTGKPHPFLVHFLVQNIGDQDSGVFTTRMMLQHYPISFFAVHDVPMHLPAHTYRLVTFPAYSLFGPQLIHCRSTADIFHEVDEYNEENNSSRLNLPQ